MQCGFTIFGTLFEQIFTLSVLNINICLHTTLFFSCFVTEKLIGYFCIIYASQYNLIKRLRKVLLYMATDRRQYHWLQQALFLLKKFINKESTCLTVATYTVSNKHKIFAKMFSF